MLYSINWTRVSEAAEGKRKQCRVKLKDDLDLAGIFKNIGHWPKKNEKPPKECR